MRTLFRWIRLDYVLAGLVSGIVVGIGLPFVEKRHVPAAPPPTPIQVTFWMEGPPQAVATLTKYVSVDGTTHQGKSVEWIGTPLTNNFYPDGDKRVTQYLITFSPPPAGYALRVQFAMRNSDTSSYDLFLCTPELIGSISVDHGSLRLTAKAATDTTSNSSGYYCELM